MIGKSINRTLSLSLAIVFLSANIAYSLDRTLRVPITAKYDNGRLKKAIEETSGLLGAQGKNLASNATTEAISVEVISKGYVFTRYLDGKSRIWKISNGELALITVLYIDDKIDVGFYGASIMPDGNLFTQDLDSKFRIWNMKGKLICTLSKEEVNAAGVYLADDINKGGTVFAKDFGGRYTLYNVDDADPKGVEIKLVANLPAEFGENITVGRELVRVLPNGNIVTHDSDNKLRIWNNKGECVITLSKLAIKVGYYNAEVLPDGNIITLDEDWRFRTWNSKGELIATLFEDGQMTAGILTSGNIFIQNKSGVVTIYNPKGEVAAVLSINKKFNVTIGRYSTKELPDGKIFTRDSDGIRRIWDISGKIISTLSSSHPSLYLGYYFVYVLSNGDILTLDYDKKSRIWNSKGELITTLSIDGTAAKFYSAHVLPDGNILTQGLDNNTYRIWNNEGKLITTLSINGTAAKFYSGNILPDGNILTQGLDYIYRIWNSKGELIAVFSLLTDGVKSGSHLYEVLRDGNILTTALADNRQRIWNVSVHVKSQQEQASAETIRAFWSSQTSL